MDELIVRLLRGETSDIEVRQVERWRAESPENERRFQETRALWALAEPEPAPAPAPPTVTELVEIADRRRGGERARARRRLLMRSPWPAWGLAAAAVGALAFYVTSHPAAPEAGVGASRLAPVESASGAADVVTMSLSDGSVVRLAGSSSIEFPSDPTARTVRLTGRAFFAVAPSDRPFVVRAAAGEVTVRGTRFEVRQDAEGLRVVVVEGTVDVAGPGGTARVAPGEVAVLTGVGAPVVRADADPWSLLDWEGGLLVFQATPLSAVAEELSRHFGRDVVVGDDRVGQRRITAWFDDEPIDEVVAAVCLVAGAVCEPVGGVGEVVLGR